jgi:hypothetical protein
MTTQPTSAGLGVSAGIMLTSCTAATTKEGLGFVVLGFGTSVEPTFAGSDKTQVEPDPIIEARYGRFFIGDLRPARFLALDAMQVLTLGGHVAHRNGAPVHSDWMAAVLYAIATTIFLHALRGMPLIRE